MQLSNQTYNDVFYSISSPGYGDCGDLAAHSAKDVQYNNMPNVKVSFQPRNEYNTLEIDIPKSGSGGVVTLALIRL